MPATPWPVDWLDFDALADYAGEADRRLAAGAVGGARAAAAAGLALVRGRLLADERDPWWAQAELTRAASLVGRLRHAAAVGALRAGAATEAATLATSALAEDSFDEEALRLLMDALSRSGRPASALAVYATFRSHLADELGVSPSPETEAIHNAILLGTHPGGEQAAPAAPDTLAGRADALARLDTLLDRAAGGRPQVIVVEGEAGIGKSTLLDAVGTRAAGRGFSVVSVAAEELGRTLPIQPILDVVDALIRRPGAPPEEEVLGSDGAVLGPLLGFHHEPVASAQLAALIDPGAGQALMGAAVFSVLRRQAARLPLAILVDDLHLAGPSTLAWLGQATRRLAGSAVLIVAARREEEGAPVPGVETLPLGPLDLVATALVVGAERAADLHARSGGHPLFLVELAAAGAGEELPASIRQAVEGRCARAGPAAPILRTAAVLGAGIDLDLLAEVTGDRPAELLDHLEEGVRRRLLVEDPAFGFSHALVRQALAGDRRRHPDGVHPPPGRAGAQR